MKKMIFFILTGAFSCQMERKPDEIPPAAEGAEQAWTVYEGRVSLNEKTSLYLEVSMLPSSRLGEGSYLLEESLEEENVYTPLSSQEGKYSTLYGDGPGEMVIQFHNSALANGVKRTYLTPGFGGEYTNTTIKMIREEVFRNTDLAVKVLGKYKLIVLDQDLKPVDIDARSNLTKRNSNLFTVEGYFRHNGDTADFLEMNTREAWAVSKLGSYDLAIRQYHQLAKEKFDVTYLKGIGFTIRTPNREGKETEALVIKKVLQMTSSPGLTPEGN